MVLFFCLTTLQNWQNCPAALTNHSGFLSIQLGFFRTSRGGANNRLFQVVAIGKILKKQILIFCELFLIVQRTCIFNPYDTDRAKEGG